MKICWDNIKDLKLSNRGNLVSGNNFYVEKDACKGCGEPFLVNKYRKEAECCSISCGNLGKKRTEEFKKKLSMKMLGENNPMYGKRGKDSPNYGRKLSEVTKAKISKVHKNKKVSKEAREKMSESQKGRIHTTETRKKLSQQRSGKNHYNYGKTGKDTPQYGLRHSEETKRKLSESRFGENNPNWQGGVSCEPYCQDWTKAYKEYIKERDNYTCLNPYCSKDCNMLSVHHINYNKKDCSSTNLITICKSCNSKANTDRDWHEAWYKAIMLKRYKYNNGEK